MAENITFNTPEGQSVARETLIACLNTGTAAEPVWAPVGVRVYSSSAEYDWQRETNQDILGNSYSNMKKPIVTQSFDPWELHNGDEAQLNIWNDGVRRQDAQAMSNKDMLIIHKYAGTPNTAVFAERYTSCAVEISSLGGDGGGNLGMPITVTYGGIRTTGTVAVNGGAFKFSPDNEGL